MGNRLACTVMSTSTPSPPKRTDLEAIANEVSAAMVTVDQSTDAPTQLQILEALHVRLAAALTTIDRA